MLTGWWVSGRTRSTPLVSGSLSQRLREMLGKPQDVLEAIVQRYGRDTHDVRVAPVAHHAALAQPGENTLAASGVAGDADRELTAASLEVGRGDEAGIRPHALDQVLEKACQRHGLRAQPLDARLPEYRQRGDQGGGGQDRGVADLPARRAGCGTELGRHPKASCRFVPPPAREVCGWRPLRVALVYEAPADRARPGVGKLVAAPH